MQLPWGGAYGEPDEERKAIARAFAWVSRVAERTRAAGAAGRIQPGARLVFTDGTPEILAYPRNRKGWANLCRLLSAGNLKEEAVKGSCILTEAELME